MTIWRVDDLEIWRSKGTSIRQIAGSLARQMSGGLFQLTMGGWNTLPGLIDFFLLVGLTRWPDTQEELDALLPPPGGMTNSLARLLRNLL